MRGRTLPIAVTPARDGDPSQNVDCAYLRRYRAATEHTRDLISGESPKPMPSTTKVVVERIGTYGRGCALMPSEEDLN